MTIVKSVRMVCSNIDNNNNKYWDAELHDNDEVYVIYGRVGVSKQSEGPFPGGEKFLNKKIREKEKKGYKLFEGLAVDNGSATISVNSDVKAIAKRQIAYSSPELEKLIERLAASNIHNIVSNTKISYNAQTGLFSTPLGIITPKMIADAKTLLATIKSKIIVPDVIPKQELLEHVVTLKRDIENYLMIVPHDLGMHKFTANTIFPDQTAFERELNILDSLEAAYTQFTNAPVKDSDPKETKEDKIFDISLDVLTDKAEYERLVSKYTLTLNKNHSSARLRIKQIYKVHISSNEKEFEKISPIIGNIKELFHGTKIGNILSIFKKGLIIPPSSANYVTGRLYGNGIYGSDQSSKAANYSYGYWSGQILTNCFLFVADFAMGKIYVPTGQGTRYNGSISYPVAGYNSTFAKAGESGVLNNEMIVYDTKQVKIKYLLELI